MKNLKLSTIIFFVSIVIFLSGVLAKLNSPLVEWDGAYISAAESVVKGEKLLLAGSNPPLYILYLASWFRFFGVENFIARLANTCALLLTSYIVFRTAKCLIGKNNALLSTALYLLSPVVIQGSTLMDTGDTTLLPLGFALFMWVVIRRYQDLSSRLNIFLIALTVALCFWLKVTSAIVLVVSVFLWFFFKGQSAYSNVEKKIILGTILGIIIFLFSWIGISLIFLNKSSCLEVLLIPLSSFRANVTTENFFFRIAEFLLYSLRIAFWFSPFLLLLFLYALWLIQEKHHGEKFQCLTFLGWVSFFYFFCYLLIGGASWGFPRYHAAILPFCVVLIGVVVEPLINRFTRNGTFIYFGLITGLSVIYVFVFDDSLFLLNLEFKQAMLFGNMDIFAKNLLVQLFFYFAFPVFIVFPLRETFLNKNFIDKVTIFLFAGIIISNVFLDIKQVRASYITSYEYGAQGKKEVVTFVLERINRGDTVFATPGFLYEFRDKEVPYVFWRVWISVESVLKELKESKPKVFILGMSTHTVGQLREILNNSQINSILNDEYEMHNIGTYSVWIRKIKGD